MTVTGAAPLVLLTRPADRTAPLAGALHRAGLRTLSWPMLTILPSRAEIEVPEGAQAVLLTSARAAAVAPGPAAALPAFCVGDATADAARKAGYAAVRSAGGDAADLARLIRRDLLPTGGPLLYFRGREVARNMASLLPSFSVREVEVYHTRPAEAPPPEVSAALSRGAFSAIAFFSPRTGGIFADAVTGEMRTELTRTRAVVMSERVAAALAGLPFRDVVIAQEPNGASIRAAICGACGVAVPQERV